MRSRWGGYAILFGALLVFSISYFFIVPRIMASTAERTVNLSNGPPRQGAFAKNPGKYEIVVRAVNQIVNPGGTVLFEAYITGYGEITVAKLYSSFPKDIIEIGENTYVTHSLGNDNTNIYFGARKETIDQAGNIMDLVGIKTEKWDYSTMFIDFNLFSFKPKSALVQTRKILTESNINKSPVEFHLKTIKEASPGIYTFKFYLIYFNGSEWNISTEKIQIEVPSWLKRHEGWAWAIGIILALIASWANAINIYKHYCRRTASSSTNNNR
jgi:hypothetical protein